MGRFAKFLGKVEVKVGDDILHLNKICVEDVQKLVDLSKRKDNEIVEGVKVITDIVHRCYPDEPREEVEAMVLANYTTLTEEIIIALGWSSREKLEAQKKELLEKKSIVGQ